jgi:hypothetical protein
MYTVIFAIRFGPTRNAQPTTPAASPRMISQEPNPIKLAPSYCVFRLPSIVNAVPNSSGLLRNEDVTGYCNHLGFSSNQAPKQPSGEVVAIAMRPVSQKMDRSQVNSSPGERRGTPESNMDKSGHTSAYRAAWELMTRLRKVEFRTPNDAKTIWIYRTQDHIHTRLGLDGKAPQDRLSCLNGSANGIIHHIFTFVVRDQNLLNW